MALSLACAPFIEQDDITCDCSVVANLDEVIEAATDLLVQLSGGRFRGRCEETVRPVRCDDWCDPGGVCCDDVDRITLNGPDPVVSEVRIDGLVLDSSEYTIIDRADLIRVAPEDRPPRWPRTNGRYLYRPDTAEGTFTITYEYGPAVDLVAKRATVEIACDLLQSIRQGGSNLGHQTTSANLDGLTLTRDPEAAESAGFSWLARFLRVWNLGGADIWWPEKSGGWTLHVVS